MPSPWMTFFTPTYNRAHTLSRVYESLCEMTTVYDSDGGVIGFEWLIVDDGSEDNTFELVENWIFENKIPIRYLWQENRGKHIAINRAVELARGEMFVIADSDDSFLTKTLEVFWKAWNEVPNDLKDRIKGVTVRCLNPLTNKLVGTPLPYKPYYATSTDMRFVDKVKGEMWGFNRLDVLKQFMFPEPSEKMNFFPESVVWYKMSEKYLEYVIDEPLRLYFQDTANSLTGKNISRAVSNYYLWQYIVNNLFKRYVFYSPTEMLKAAIGMSMTGFKAKKSKKSILNDVKSRSCKFVVGIFMPLGYILSKIR